MARKSETDGSLIGTLALAVHALHALRKAGYGDQLDAVARSAMADCQTYDGPHREAVLASAREKMEHVLKIAKDLPINP